MDEADLLHSLHPSLTCKNLQHLLERSDEATAEFLDFVIIPHDEILVFVI